MVMQFSADPTTPNQEPGAYALEQIRRANIHREPFPHILIEGLFPNVFFKRLLENFPDRSHFQRVEYPGTGHGRTAATYHDYGWACKNLATQPVFSDVHAVFKSEPFARTLLEKFRQPLPDGFLPIPIDKHRYFEKGATNFTSVFDLQIDLPGYEIPPHPDVPSKLITYQFFLPADDSLRDYGTLFCKPKNGRNNAQRARFPRVVGALVTRVAESFRVTHTPGYKRLERGALGVRLGIGDNRNWLPWSLVDVVKVAPAGPNYFMAFAPNAISYHAVRFDIAVGTGKQERPVIRGFIRAGADAKNWIQAKQM